MYLWMVLAAFLATLAAYILPLRNDMDKVVDNPIAEAMMMKFKVKHYAIEKMMEDYSCRGSRKDSFMLPSNKCENLAFYQATTTPDSFSDKSNAPIDYTHYAPFGFQNRLDPNYKSQIKCFCAVTDEDGTVSYTNTDCTDSNDDCPDGGVVKHGVLTIGKVPQHWLMQSPNGPTPTNDLIDALRKNFSGGIAAGILVEQGGQPYIQNYSKTETATSRLYPIPSDFDLSECTGEVCFGYFSWK